MDVSEKNFEAQIEHVLRNTHGYQKRDSHDHYDPALCLIPDDVIDFIYATQPKEWEKLKRVYGEDARRKFLWRLSEQIEKRGTLDVLRKGIRDAGAKVKLVFFRPSSTLNEKAQQLYEANIFSVVRQLYYKEGRKFSVDLGIFLNGMPLFTAELKNPFTGQTVLNAVRQYKKDRDPREPLFHFGRCLVHFAVDPRSGADDL